MTRIPALLAMLSILAGLAVGQEARLSGTVADPSGASIPSVAVTATQGERQVIFQAQTDDEGRYLFQSCRSEAIKSARNIRDLRQPFGTELR